MILYNVYQPNRVEVVNIWRKDLKKIIKRYADVTYVVNKVNKKKVKFKNPFKRRKVYDYRCVFDGSVYHDGYWTEDGRCDIWYV